MNFNPKGVLFYLSLAAVAVCATIAYGPKNGMVAFGLLAVIVLLFG